MLRLSSLRYLLLPLLLAATLSACATRPPATDREALAEFEATNDPLEPFNRSMYAVNRAVDTVVLVPVATAYRTLVPPPVRTGVRNALGNLRAPTILLNDVLQGNLARAQVTAGRFLINSTLGLGGLVDVAEWQFGLRGHAEDFGQTLAVWGVSEGPYLFLPVFGPSNPRDLVGTAVDAVASPWFWFGQGAVVEGLRWGRLGLTIVDTRESVLDSLDALERMSLDPYAALRSAYRQRRNAEIRNQGIQAPEAAGAGFGAGMGVPASAVPGAAAPANTAPAPAAR
ncbi:MAG: VacJ family lipoprotein [Acetobacteraceae bacterium]|nr:VacJ family lipoprotein [Acetobacteraceae bacterium]